MATINEIMELLTSTFSDATMVRTNKTNCLAIPTDVIENGMPKYLKVQLGSFATKATKTHEAFDFDTARADYEQWAKEAAERASKPKGDNSKKPRAQSARASALTRFAPTSPRTILTTRLRPMYATPCSRMTPTLSR